MYSIFQKALRFVECPLPILGRASFAAADLQAPVKTLRMCTPESCQKSNGWNFAID